MIIPLLLFKVDKTTKNEATFGEILDYSGHPQCCYTRGKSGPRVCFGHVAAQESRVGPEQVPPREGFFLSYFGAKCSASPLFYGVTLRFDKS